MVELSAFSGVYWWLVPYVKCGLFATEWLAGEYNVERQISLLSQSIRHRPAKLPSLPC